MLQAVLFYILAIVIVISALAMVLSRNLVHSALFMAAAFLGMAFVYLLLQADYVAVVQILVYVGAVSVLFVFGVMLTKRARMEDTNRFSRSGVIAVFVGLALFALLLRAITISGTVTAIMAGSAAGSDSAPSGSAASISGLLLGDMALPLEASGLLLLAALTGAIALGRSGRRPS
ncbi:MAG TPA: NADH-quinone oxidoreductase subunit J [Spirochaetia bacterium]|nr:NADH-quinone oxidoreductase subunit J [Spirochaetia bacterium]